MNIKYLCLLAPAIVIIFANKRISLLSIKLQNEFWGTKFGKKEVNANRIACVAIGVGIALVSVVGFLG